jgi:hypothetical protein
MPNLRLAFRCRLDAQEWEEYALNKGWRRLFTTNVGEWEDRDDDVAEQGWLTSTGDEVRFVRDDVIEVQYVIMTGPAMHEVADSVRTEFLCVDYVDCMVLFKAATASDERSGGLYMLAATAPDEPDEQVIQLVQEAVLDDSKDVRLAAVAVAIHSPWLEFEDSMSKLGETDPEALVRDLANDAVVVIRSHARDKDS